MSLCDPHVRVTSTRCSRSIFTISGVVEADTAKDGCLQFGVLELRGDAMKGVALSGGGEEERGEASHVALFDDLLRCAENI